MLRILRLHILPILALALLGSLNAVRTTYASDNSSDQIIGTEQGNSGVQLQDDQNKGSPVEIQYDYDVDRVRQATTTRSSALPVKFPHFINSDRLALKDSRSLNSALKPRAFDIVFLSIEDRKTLRKKE